jgi:RimJ/RimL family protein N-acetyltransferase
VAAAYTPYWPLAGLELRLGEMTLRPVADADLDALCDLLPLEMEMNPATPRPFRVAEKVARGVALRQEHWSRLGRWTPDSWTLDFLVQYDARIIGVQELEAADFRVLRTVETASWLGPDFRGRGLGKLMRAAVLTLAFDGLDAETALTEAWSDNDASLGVSRSLGYLPNGSVPHTRDGVATEMPRFLMDRSGWRAVPRPDVTISGLHGCLPWFVAPEPTEVSRG